MNIKQALKFGEIELNNENILESKIKVKMLLSNLIKKSKEYLLIHDDEIIEKEIELKFLEGIERLKKEEPIQYIIEKQEFFGMDFFVNKNVLIPQPDTEILVEEVLNIIQKKIQNKDIKILDLCTGSGAIGISIKKYIDEFCKKNKYQTNLEVVESDISEKALEVAKINAERNKVDIQFIESDLFEKINDKFDIIVSNPPYIETHIIESLAKEVQNEPKLALDGGIDGLKFYRDIIKNALNFLNPEGVLALEIGYDQKEKVIEILKQNDYNEIYSKKDLGNNDRIVIAKKII